MNSILQLFILTSSVFFGFLLGIVTNINVNLYKTKYLVLRLVSQLLVSLLVAILYITFLYYVNSGQTHIYFYGMILVGYILFFVCKKRINKRKPK